MAQHDYSIANQGFPATRADINNVLSAIATNNSGTSAPSTQYAGQFWIDTTSSTWTLYIHDGADDIQFATIDTSANTVNFIDSELGDNSVTTAKIADGNVTSAKLSYPLTTFSSTGIDDNATSTAITINSSQQVGIGTASAGFPLEINSSTQTTLLRLVSTAGTSSDITFANTGSNDTIAISSQNDDLKLRTDDGAITFFTNENSEKMRIDSSGQVGIGTSSPNRQLTIAGGTNTGLQICGNGTGTGSGDGVLMFVRDSDDGFVLNQRENSFVSFETNNTERMRIDSSGHAIIPAGVTLGTSAGTYNASNTLDDYEEGLHTVTMTDTGGGATITMNTSFDQLSYTKIGRMVHIQGVLLPSSVTGTFSGTTQITLPFTASNETDQAGKAFFLVGTYSVDFTTGTSPYLAIGEGNAYGNIQVSEDNGSGGLGRVNGSSQLYISGSYITNA